MNPTRYHDGAVKVAPLGKSGAAIYAGNTDAGEAALEWLHYAFRKAELGAPSEDLRDVLRNAYRTYKRGDGDILQFAFGFFDGKREPHLFRLDSWSGFAPFEVWGSTWLGSEIAAQHVKNQLAEKLLTDAKDGNSATFDAAGWAGLIETMIWKAAEQAGDQSVGGQTKSLVVRPDGIESQSLFVLHPGSPQEGAKQISLAPEDVQSFYEHNLRKRNSRHRANWKFIPKEELRR